MADKPVHAAPKIKPSVRHHSAKSLLGHRNIDIKPAGTAPATATSRPVVVSAKPQHADTTLRRHHGVQPLAPAAPLVTMPAVSLPTQPVTVPSPAPQPVPPVPSPAPAATVTPAVPVAPAVAVKPSGPPQPPVPEVSAPPNLLLGHEQDELELANLTGVHGIVEKPVDGSGAVSPVAPAPAPAQAMQLTPAQATQLAAALKELPKQHSRVDENPVVVVHRHDYLHSIAIFFGFALGAMLFVAVILDLILDIGLLDLPVQPLTNFF